MARWDEFPPVRSPLSVDLLSILFRLLMVSENPGAPVCA